LLKTGFKTGLKQVFIKQERQQEKKTLGLRPKPLWWWCFAKTLKP